MNFMRPPWITRFLPKRAGNESVEDWRARRAQFREDLRKDNDPLVYAQEYLAEFVDWSGVAFFSREKLLVEIDPFLCLLGVTPSSRSSTPPPRLAPTMTPRP